MIKKLQRWLQQMKHNWKYASCYSRREYDGYASMDCCGGLVGGDKNTGNLQYACVSCPYYVEIIEGSKNNGK